jgi:peptide/nickel transport system permease protein
MNQAKEQPELREADGVTRRAELPFRRSMVGRVVYQLLGRWGARLGLLWMFIIAFFAVFAPFIANSHPILFKADGRWSSPMLSHLTHVDVTLAVFSVAVIVLFFARGMAIGHRCAISLWVLSAIIPLAGWGEVARGWSHWQQQVGTPILVFASAVCGLVLLALLAVVPLMSTASRRAKLLTLIMMSILAVLLIAKPVLPPRTVVMSQYREAITADEAEYALYTLIPFSPTDRMRDLPDTRLMPPGAYPRQQRYGNGDRPEYAEAWTQEAYPDEALGARRHLMGTTAYGEDLASRMIHACRIALSIGFIATSIALFLGVVIGALMGYFSGWVDLLGMRLVEIFSAIPTIYLLIAVVAFYGRNLYLMMVIIGLTGWVGYAMFTRAEFLKLRQQDFVQAARACGLPLWSILFKHMLPNGVAPVLVSASFGIAAAILTEATLSFLGLGLVDEPSWGQMLNQARSVGGGFFWWIAIYPGGAIFLTVFAYNLVGEAMRDAIDPYAQKPGT